jgi:hypothetical protein
MARILERYSQAVHSDCLTVDERTTFSDTDVLGAAALASRTHALGIALVRLFADGKPELVTSILTEMAFKRARFYRLKFGQVQAADIAKAVLGWHRHGACKPCGGTGFAVIPGTPSLGSGCEHCRESGRIPFDEQFPDDTLELAKWLSTQIEREQAMAGSAAMAMLAPRIDLTNGID